MQRLVSRAELAKRVTCVRSYVYKECKEGGILFAAMVGQQIDLNHPAAYAFCHKHGYKEPDTSEITAQLKDKQSAKAKPAYTQAPAHDTYSPDDEEFEEINGATNFMDLTLKEIVQRYGRQAKFKEYVSAYKILVQTQAAEEKMARERKEYAHWSHFERLAMHIDGLQKMLMSDTAKNIAETAKTLTAAGADDNEVRKAVTRIMEQTIQMAKTQSDKVIRNAKQ